MRGAFTGAVAEQEGLFRAARGGTLLLDEAGDIPLSLQPTLLRVLETWQVRPVGSSRDVAIDVRVVAASHRELVAWSSRACSAPTSTPGWRSGSSASRRCGIVAGTSRRSPAPCWSGSTRPGGP